MTLPGRNAMAALLASPREPSGASWLINCLLELGVRVDLKAVADRTWTRPESGHRPAEIWQPADEGGHRLHPRADALRKWLPVLARRETLVFREGVEVLYVQDLPRPELRARRTVIFVRDPRDAIHSLYRRVRPDLSVYDFVRFPHPETLLDAIAHWRLFVESWLAREEAAVLRFEDYKSDAEATLRRALAALGVDVPAAEIARAVSESSFEKSRVAEARYRGAHPGDEEVAMRAGRVGEWTTAPDLLDLSREIEGRAGELMTRLGYPCAADAAETTLEGASQIQFLSAFDRVDLPAALREAADAADPMACPLLRDTLELASTIDVERIQRARLPIREARTLLDSMEEYCTGWQEHRRERVGAVRSELDYGGNHHLSGVRALLASRRKRPSPAQDDPSGS